MSIGEDTDPDTSNYFTGPNNSGKHNVLFYRRESLALDNGDTRVITFANYATTEWVLILARVIGTAKLTTAGVDADGSTSITGDTGGYGTAAHPGIIGVTTKNVTTFTLEGLADGTEVEYIACILAEDDDARLTTYA